MRVSPPPEEIGRIVVRTFQQLGLPVQAPWDLHETVLIDEGKYRGRSYRQGHPMAMWLAEVGILQFYDADGTMLRTLNLCEELVPQRMAA